MHTNQPTRNVKREPFTRVSKLFLVRFWLDDKAKNKYVGRRATIFNDDGLLFVKSYEVIHDFYTKRLNGKPPLITGFAAYLYCDLLLQLKRGEAFTLDEYAHAHEVNKKTLLRALDELEDANLMHREMGVDGSEHRIVYVPHTPLKLEDLLKQHDCLLARREMGWAKQRRERAGLNNRSYLPRSLSWKTLLAAFDGNESKAERFENIVGDVVITHLTDANMSPSAFLEIVSQACAKHSVLCSDYHLQLAVGIRAYIAQTFEPTTALSVAAHNKTQLARKPKVAQSQSLVAARIDDAVATFASLIQQGWGLKKIQTQFEQTFSPHEWQAILARLS